MKTIKSILMGVAGCAIALGMTMCCKSDDAASKGASSADAVIDNIMTRTSVRDYTDEAVSDSLVETMLRAAMAAPTAVNLQP